MKERSPGPTPHEAIRRHVEAAIDWEWHEIASQLYVWTDRFNDRFFEHGMPETVLSFESMDHRILAAYTLRRNAQGLLYEITFNTKHLRRALWETLETLMHEYVHLWQQNFGEHPVQRNYHNVEFVQRCEALGLHPAVGSGAHLKPADGVFAEFLKGHSIAEPEPIRGVKLNPKGKPLDWWANPRERRRGRSTLVKWSCGCQNVRVGTKEFHAQCLKCGRVFERVDPEDEKQQADGAEDKPSMATGWEQGILDLSATSDEDEPNDETRHDTAASGDSNASMPFRQIPFTA
jgi:hypothetical protein